MNNIFIQLAIWYVLWGLVRLAGEAGNPLGLLLPISISYYLIVIKQTHTRKKNGD